MTTEDDETLWGSALGLEVNEAVLKSKAATRAFVLAKQQTRPKAEGNSSSQIISISPIYRYILSYRLTSVLT